MKIKSKANNKRKYTLTIVVALVLLSLVTMTLAMTGCSATTENNAQPEQTAEVQSLQEPSFEFMEPIKVKKNPIATFDIRGYGKINIELFPDKAPNTVLNFIKVIRDKGYDKSGFWRCQSGFVLQGGALNNDHMTPSKFSIPGEFSGNGYKYNDIEHTKGIVSMAKLQYDNNSASQQFFICLSDECGKSLDSMFAAFGKIADAKSMKICKRIEKREKSNPNNMGALYKLISFRKATVNTYGVKYDDPFRIEK